ncbi:IS110 family transposase [candidate division KSB1 bacterium]|nr:IS110 family transposase [candidate division KSB1 bacterium]
MYYVGIDWADQKHDVTVVDEQGAIALKNFTLKKNPAGFAQLLEKLRGLSAEPNAFKVGIETPHNLLVDYLLDFEYAVFARFPGTMKSLRRRYRPSGARDDAFDAFVLADALRTDQTGWRAVDLGSELVREIRLCARHHHQLLEEHVAAGNGLRATLKEYYPEFVEFFADVTCANARAFLCAYPEFELAARLTHEKLAAFFKEHHLRNGKIVNAIFARLHQPHLAVAAPLKRVKQIKALSCAKRLETLAADLAHYEHRLEELVAQHPDGKIFLSYPGAATVTAARLLALFGDNRALYRDVRELQALAGTCPVTEKSGKNFRVVYFRRACNKFYRDTLHYLAFSSLKEAPWARAYYDRHRRAGHKHSHALRCLGNVHLRVLFAMWQTKTCYDENLFLAQRARSDMAQQKNLKK